MIGRSRRFVCIGLFVALTASMCFGIISACYNAPEPVCGFVCGPNNECPEDYTCVADHRCHLNGSPPNTVCTSDAAVDSFIRDGGQDSPLGDGPGDADTSAPTVVSAVPADNATNVSVSTTIVVTFSEPVTNVTTTTFTVAGGSAITGTIASSGGGTIYTFTPDSDLPGGTPITVTLTSAITDTAGNPLAPVTFSFATA